MKRCVPLQACIYARWTPLELDYLLGHLVSATSTNISVGCLAESLRRTCDNSPLGARTAAPAMQSSARQSEAEPRARKTTRWLLAMGCACDDRYAASSVEVLCSLGTGTQLVSLALNSWAPAEVSCVSRTPPRAGHFAPLRAIVSILTHTVAALLEQFRGTSAAPLSSEA